MISAAADLARRLARDAEAVCRHYLSNGRRSGHYWIAGDVMNTPLPRPPERIALAAPAPSGSPEAARRLFRSGRPIPGTPAEAYLRARGITGRLDWPALRYHPSVYYRAAEDAPLELWPALLAAVTGLDGAITGILRTWLDPRHPAKAPLADPRRALGYLLGNGVRFGIPTDTLAAGEGLENVLALKSVLPLLPMIAGLSANHLAALDLPPAPGSGPGQALCRLYVARDNDAAGLKAANRLRERAAEIDVRELVPVHGDFNLDLCRLGPDGMLAHLADQLVPSDLARFRPVPSPLLIAVDRCARFRPVSRRNEERLAAVPAGVPWPERAARAAFPSGDLPEAPGGKGAALSRFAMARINYFPPPPEGGGFASRSKIVAPRHPPLCSGPAGAKPSPPPARDRREGRDGRG